MSAEQPTSGSNHRAPKKLHGRSWLAKRARTDKSWKERKMTSRRYCAPVVEARVQRV